MKYKEYFFLYIFVSRTNLQVVILSMKFILLKSVKANFHFWR